MMGLSSADVKKLRDRIQAAGGLVNQSDLARVWQVSRARVGQLAAVDGFPEPIGRVGGRPVWLREQCDRWRRSRRRDLELDREA